jgi:biopolymer transport protein ExbB
MNRLFTSIALIIALALPGGATLAAGTLDGQPRQAISLEQLLDEVRQSRGAEQRHHREREARFLQEKNRQQALLQEARAQEQREERRANDLRRQFERNEARLAELEQTFSERAGELQTVFSIARQSALDAQASLQGTLLTAQFEQWPQRLADIAVRPHALSIEDMESLWLTILEATVQNGKVSRFEAPVITARGDESVKTVTRVGVFNAVSDGKFLRYLPETEKLVELSRQPPPRFTSLAAGLEGSSSGFQLFPIDPSRGAILSLIVHSPNMLERIDAGGIIGYLIIVIGIISLGIALARYTALVLTRRKINAQSNSGEISEGNPLGRLHLIAGKTSHLSSKALSARLHEKLGEESASLHRGLRTLAIFAAIAPLLGLLGTVTGMIETFQAITLFGSGDPRIMSGGISQALVTTELGLAVAIPVLLIHSFLNGQANRLVEVLEHHSSLIMSKTDGAH